MTPLKPRFGGASAYLRVDVIALICFREKRKLGFCVAAGIGELSRIISRKAVVGVLRPDGIAALLAHGPVNAVERQCGFAGRILPPRYRFTGRA